MLHHHSAAEDNIIFPAVSERASQSFSFVNEHVQEELLFRSFQSVLESVCDADIIFRSGVMDELCNQADRIVENVQCHLREESGVRNVFFADNFSCLHLQISQFTIFNLQVFPLVQKYLNIQEQQALFYQCLRMMPLKVLEKMLPWLTALLSGEEVKDMLCNIKQAGEEVSFFLSMLVF